MQWMRKAADNGYSKAYLCIARDMYLARELGHVVEAAEVARSAGGMEGHDVPPDVLTGVVHWLRKGDHDPVRNLQVYRRAALEGGMYCYNETCRVRG
jgi:hypothetical protein